MKYLTVVFAALLALFHIGLAQQSRNQESKLASDIAANLARQTGVAVYLDSRVAKEKVLWPAVSELVKAEKLEDEIDRLAKALPQGAVWAKLYLPPPAGKTWKGDDVLAYARAQAQLYGKVGAVEDDVVEILSQKLTPEKSKEVTAALNLKPVYIIALGRGTFAGVWNTTFGEMRLQQSGTRVVGTYTSGAGEIQGVVAGNTLSFRWYERERGSGGPGVFTLSEDGESFTGQWAYDGGENDSTSTWSGTRISRR